MTVILDETEQLADLDAKVPCECPLPGHGDGCEEEAEFSVVLPCGHCHELLCRPCTDMCVESIEAGCPDCGGPLSCRVCKAVIERLVVRPI
ncbi:hypothetical protein FEF26_04275 [Nesterenkonia salmonea]|uniref:Uncharacterized protein n=1 Tax=Nesterenkonia salmonea TaxID=1804987 RepID=A0A5R9BFC6_9MICC|nr:hypothetical protein [Nesterenkonia salmonea]TLP98620.1 hypothetical protein FEF26_04275 [Nesterenkonia salmonea]